MANFMKNVSVDKIISVGGMVLTIGGAILSNVSQSNQMNKTINKEVKKEVAKALAKQHH